MRADSPNLDVLRSLAVLLVVASHLPVPWLSTMPSYHWQALGLIGVLIFFVHTCLVLMLSLERQTVQDGDRYRALLFLVRRAFRIYPLSVVTVLLVSAVAYYSSGQFNAREILSNLLLIQNITGDPSNPGALWSLPYEVQMYLLLPLFYAIVARTKSAAPLYLGAIWLAATGFVLALWTLGLNYHLVKYLPCFIPGVIAFSLHRSDRVLSPWLLFLYVVALAVLFPVAVALGARENVLSWPVCLALGLLIPKCTEINNAWLGKVAKLVARYSFGIYLVHGPLIDFAFKYWRAAPNPVQWLVFIFGTAAFSYLAFHRIERPCIELGRRLTHRLSRSSAPMRVAEPS